MTAISELKPKNPTQGAEIPSRKIERDKMNPPPPDQRSSQVPSKTEKPEGDEKGYRGAE